MKIIIDTEKEIETIKHLFNAVKKDRESGAEVGTAFDGIGYMDNGVCGEVLWFGEPPTFYFKNEHGKWEIYDFKNATHKIEDAICL